MMSAGIRGRRREEEEKGEERRARKEGGGVQGEGVRVWARFLGRRTKEGGRDERTLRGPER
jgi:hypothetical protein